MENSILKGKILIVEDDLPSRLYLNKILKTGAVLINAGDGSEAVRIAGKIPILY